jgi:D-amino-acid dehydrogenase
MPCETPRQVTIIGAGVVGTVCANYLLREGHNVTLIDRTGPGEMTSFGNTGGISPASVVPVAMPGMLKDIPRWLRDPYGPLHVRWTYLPHCLPWLLRFLRFGRRNEVLRISKALTQLNMPTFDAYMPLLRDAGLENLFHQTGQLFVYRSHQALEHDKFAIDLKRATGLRVDILNSDEIRQLEPTLSKAFTHAHFIPDHGHCKNPFRLVQGLAEHFVRHGGKLVRTEIRGIELGPEGPTRLMTADGSTKATCVVIAAGVWSRNFTRRLGHHVPLESHRGYHVTLPNPETMPRFMVLSVEDKIAITPMEMGLRIGGTVELAGLDAPPNYVRAQNLLKLGQRALPGLRSEGMTRWMGHRPCLPDSLPVIGPSPKVPNLYFAFGHGHQGLLGASKTGQVIAELVSGRPASIGLAPFRVDRFD